jgi:hypothetical protein
MQVETDDTCHALLRFTSGAMARPPSMGPDERNLIDNAEGADHD